MVLSFGVPVSVILLGPICFYLATLSAGKIARGCVSRKCCAYLDDKDIEELALLCQ